MMKEKESEAWDFLSGLVLFLNSQTVFYNNVKTFFSIILSPSQPVSLLQAGQNQQRNILLAGHVEPEICQYDQRSKIQK